MKNSMRKMIDYGDLCDWIAWKKGNHFMNSADYQNGYLDALENLLQDMQEGRLAVHLFEGTEEDSIVL